MKIDENLLTGIWFKDRVDPVNPRFRLIEIRVPMEPSLAKEGYAHEYVGRALSCTESGVLPRAFSK